MTAIITWLEERLPLDAVRKLIKKKTVPAHKHSMWYYLGGMALFLFITQVVTGILLILYYNPNEGGAFESVQFIMTQVHFGWLVRSIHSWGANLFILVIFVHMFSVFFLKAYRKPRELTWVSGMLLFFLALGFGFSGYLLPWNEVSFFATKVGTDIVDQVPVFGAFLKRFLRGGDEITGATLTRFYGFHIAVLPMITTLLLVLHVLLVQHFGMSIPPSVKRQEYDVPFFPNFILRDVFGWLCALGILAALAAMYPWELGVKADPFAPAPEGIMPEWYFVFMFQTLKLVPSTILLFEGEVLAILSFGAIGLFWLAIPFLERRSSEGRQNRLFTAIGITGIIYIIGLTVYAYLE